MKAQTIDIHGKNQVETEDLFMGYLNESRLKNEMKEVTFITGVGVLQKKLKNMATEQGLEWHIPMSNPGCIVIYFE